MKRMFARDSASEATECLDLLSLSSKDSANLGSALSDQQVVVSSSPKSRRLFLFKGMFHHNNNHKVDESLDLVHHPRDLILLDQLNNKDSFSTDSTTALEDDDYLYGLNEIMETTPEEEPPKLTYSDSTSLLDDNDSKNLETSDDHIETYMFPPSGFESLLSMNASKEYPRFDQETTPAITPEYHPPIIQKKPRVVSFGKVQVREYERIVGDNPSVRSGPPLSLGWRFSEKMPQYWVDDYEIRRKPRRTREQLIVDAEFRECLLRDVWDISPSRILKAEQLVQKIQDQRLESMDYTCGERFEIAASLTKSCLSKVIRKKKKKEVEYNC